MNNSINQIKDTCLQVLPGSKVLLFGSRARNDNSEDSDFDLIVITKEELNREQKLRYKAKIRTLLAQMKIAVDILIQSDNEIEIKRKITGHIVKQAFDEGVKI